MSRRDRERREKRSSTAKRWSQQHDSGYSTTKFKLPEGLGFWQVKEDVVHIEIIPFVAGKGNPYAKPGELHFERTYWEYKNIGADPKSYVAPGKTFGAKDYIAEYAQEVARQSTRNEEEENKQKELLKSLRPKERQLFLIYDHAQQSKGLQLWDLSFHLFGKRLVSRLEKADERYGYEEFYYPDEYGYTLRLEFDEKSLNGNKFFECSNIEFVERSEALPESLVEHGYCLDDFLVHVPYEKLRAIFRHEEWTDPDDNDNEEDESEKPSRRQNRRMESADGAESRTKEDRNTADEKKSETTSSSKSTSAPTTTSTRSPEKSRHSRPGVDKPKPVETPFEKGDSVEYKGSKCTIAKISGDGTSYTLIDADDEVIKAVSAEELKAWKDKPKAKAAPEPEPEDDDVPFNNDEKPAAVGADEDDDDDVWDDDF